MKRLLAIVAMTAFSIQASAGCVSNVEKNLLKLQALISGSVKLFVSHSDLSYGTSAYVIGHATEDTLAELNSQGEVVYLTESWVPYVVPGFEAFATAAGVQKLHDLDYCFGKID